MAIEQGSALENLCEKCPLRNIPDTGRRLGLREMIIWALHNVDDGDSYSIGWNEMRCNYGYLPQDEESAIWTCYMNQLDIRPCDEA